MKTKQTIFRLSYVLGLLILAFTFNGCSDDSDDNDTNADLNCESLLECQEDTVWRSSLESGFYFVIRNNSNNPFTLFYEEGSCYLKTEASEIGDVIIMEQSSTMFKYKDEGTDWMETTTITYSNNQIKVKVEYYEDGDLVETENLTFAKTDMSVSSLNLCP